ncbi:reverse transcriptase [Gossypium australe]|uniref:Reverse transcriptase n=1 Tax=Gossypium australe TaxID=47621 RepID=A0A5B6VMY6_9ROSI|nr:reverse transcriptase [Gossypium australe]
MNGCLAVDAKGKSGGLAFLWKDGAKVTIQSYSKYHGDASIGMEDGMKVRFIGFYGHTDSIEKKQAWDMLRRIKNTVREGWMVGGDFNAILNANENEGWRRKPKVAMDEFRELLEELNLVDIKTRGSGFIKERLDCFLVSDDIVNNMPFIKTTVVRQSKSDHDAILMDTVGSKPREQGGDPKHWFRYDTCWSKEKEAEEIVSSIWSRRDGKFIERIEEVRERLGPWQYNLSKL